MGDFYDDDQFKTPDQFNKELDVLEAYHNAPNANNHISRMSLYTQFDPLVGLPKSPMVQPVSIKSEPVTVKSETHDSEPSQEAVFNESSTLIHINTPSTKKSYENKSHLSNNEANVNGHLNMDELLDVKPIKQEDDIQMQVLLSELALINEKIVDLAIDQMNSHQQQFSDTLTKEDKLIAEKNELLDELNKVEKNYFDSHTRYENMKTLVKEMDNRDAANKDKVSELVSKLNAMDKECRKWKQVAEESVEKANLRMQSAANKESVALKAQVKVLEMKVNSLQMQIEQKNRENEELSHIVEELINKN